MELVRQIKNELIRTYRAARCELGSADIVAGVIAHGDGRRDVSWHLRKELRAEYAPTFECFAARMSTPAAAGFAYVVVIDYTGERVRYSLGKIPVGLVVPDAVH